MAPAAKPATAPVVTDTSTVADPEDVLVGFTASLDDGPVTFTRPGIESREFKVKDGKISTTREGHDWLLLHVAGTTSAAE